MENQSLCGVREETSVGVREGFTWERSWKTSKEGIPAEGQLSKGVSEPIQGEDGVHGQKRKVFMYSTAWHKMSKPHQ